MMHACELHTTVTYRTLKLPIPVEVATDPALVGVLGDSQQ